MERFRFSSRTQWNLAPNELSRRASELRRRGKSLIDLTESNPTRCGLIYPQQEILAALAHDGSLSYEPSPKGLFTARSTIARYCTLTSGHDFDPEHVFLTASTSEAYSFLFRLLADPGDCVAIPHPSYPLLDYLAQLNDIELKPYALDYQAGWHVDFHSLEAALNSRTRAVLVVNPNNPTGSGIRPEERDRLVALCRDRKLSVISDEVFIDFGFSNSSTGIDATRPSGPQELRSLVGETGILTFVLNGISKMLGLPQMKLAWIAASGPQEWLAPALDRLEIIADTYLSVSTPIQLALPALFSEVRPKIQPQILDRIQKNLEVLDDCVSRTGGLCGRLVADGGWSAVVTVPRVHSEEDWVLRWLEQDGVLVHPGYFFDFPSDGYIVLSLLPPVQPFREAVQRLLARVQSEIKR